MPILAFICLVLLDLAIFHETLLIGLLLLGGAILTFVCIASSKKHSNSSGSYSEDDQDHCYSSSDDCSYRCKDGSLDMRYGSNDGQDKYN